MISGLVLPSVMRRATEARVGSWYFMRTTTMLCRAAFNLAIKVRWPIGKTIGVLLSGTIPLLGIIVEHFQTKDVKTRFGL